MSLVLADFVDRADVRMIQCSSSAGFAQEALEGLCIARILTEKELQRDVSAERRVLGAVNHPHSATAQSFHDAVVGHGLADKGIRAGHGAGILGGCKRSVNADTCAVY